MTNGSCGLFLSPSAQPPQPLSVATLCWRPSLDKVQGGSSAAARKSSRPTTRAPCLPCYDVGLQGLLLSSPSKHRWIIIHRHVRGAFTITGATTNNAFLRRPTESKSTLSKHKRNEMLLFFLSSSIVVWMTCAARALRTKSRPNSALGRAQQACLSQLAVLIR